MDKGHPLEEEFMLQISWPKRAMVVAVGSKKYVTGLIDKYKHKTMVETATNSKTKHKRL